MRVSSIVYLVINLPNAVERRQAICAQAEQYNLPLQIIPAVSGNDLPQHTGYNRFMRHLFYANDLLPNEIGCTLSHKKALQTFLETSADYVVILEDDALLAPFFKEGIQELVERLKGWEVVKLFTDDGQLHPLLPHCQEAVVQPVFPQKLPWVSVGYMYTRHAARLVYEGMQSYWLPTDALIGKILLEGRIPTIGVQPGLVHSADPNNLTSSIDATGVRTTPRLSRNLFQFLAYRASVLLTGLAKKYMRRMMRRRLSRH